MQRNLPPVDALTARAIATKIALKRKNYMPDKITMINVVWMTVVTGMLAATIALYDQKVDQSKVYGPFASARPFISSQY
jgi:hypothetical protein